ncbi:MAG: site-2 protease family protein [Candidatus Cloacimonetes bacterium]|nr:site-2 protease family protein [Candidatus Cloacimonadota bacterium]
MSFLLKLLFQVPVLLLSLTIHEYSHGRVAYLLGDDTAKRAGRLTLNPISHIDPIGLLMLFVVHIGWAKPVPINPHNFKNYKRDTALTAAAGPVSNFLMAILLSIIFALARNSFPNQYLMNGLQSFIISFLFYGILINLALGIFNLIPIPPMDGSKILGGFLTDEQYYKYTAKEHQGAMILMLIFAVDYFLHLGIIGRIIRVPLSLLLRLLTGIEI